MLDGTQDRLPPEARVIGYGGSAGGGKTDALLAAGGIGAISYPRSRWAFFRRKFVELEGLGGAIDRSHELFTGLATYNGARHRWTFKNGSRLQFCHCHREANVYDYQSQQFDGLLFDEATHFTEYQVNYLLTRNRATVDGVVPFAALATNPGNVGHLWFKRWMIDPGSFETVHEVAPDEEKPWETERHLFIRAQLADNQILEKRDPGYRRNLELKPAAIKRALLDGDWDSFLGQVFEEWRRHRHVCKAFKIPVGWVRWRSVDWGYAQPFCCLWFAMNPDTGQKYVYRELYKAGLNDPVQAAKIRELTGEPKYEPVEHDPSEELIASSYVGKTKLKKVPPELVAGEKIQATLADPSMWTKRTTEAITTTSADVYKKNGVPLTRGDNDRLIGKRRVHDALAWERDGAPLYPDGRPGLVLFENCVNGIRTLPALPYDEIRVEDVDTGAEDHWYDAARYGLSYKVRGKRKKPVYKGDKWAAARRK
jgi:hypothetical protein